MSVSEKTNTAVAEPDIDVDVHESVEEATRKDQQCRRQPRYNVILWDSDDHSYEYVTTMMRALFGFDAERGYEIAREVDTTGRAICLTTTMEHAELKRDQIHAYGRDRAISRCAGSMSASIEAEG